MDLKKLLSDKRIVISVAVVLLLVVVGVIIAIVIGTGKGTASGQGNLATETMSSEVDSDSIDIIVNGDSDGSLVSKSKVRRVTVHDPSIVKDEETGMYYIFGSHMAWGKSEDMISWTLFSNNINRDYATLFAAEAEWAKKAGTAYNVKDNLWAPDVIYNEAMDKWCMYMSVNGPMWNSTIVLLTADSPDGDWTYVGPVIQSGMSNGFGVTFDYEKATGESAVATNRYTLRKNTPQWEPHAIDPCVIYDKDGNLWMSYGSWSGGIGLFRLDNETGLRSYEVKYEYKSGVSDPYFGYKISGGNQKSGEASYIERIGDYYYMFISYGGLVANGGYNMRVFRAEEITGPYVDMSGEDARYPLNAGDPGSTATGDVNGTVGNKVMTYYKWSYSTLGQVAQGHNSVWTEEDGSSFLVYHKRTDNGTEVHQVRVHQMFLNEDGWLVTAPHDYRGEALSEHGYKKDEVVGSYEVLVHRQSINYEGLECVTGQEMILNADGSVSGEFTGTWEVKDNSPYITIKEGNITYKGVLVKQMMEDTDYEVMCFTLIGDNEVSMWGSKYVTGEAAVELSVASKVAALPNLVETDMEFLSEALYHTTLTYSSDKPDVISNDGKVTPQESRTQVNLVATFTNGDYTKTQEYVVTVKAKSEIDQAALDSKYYEGFNNDSRGNWTSANAAGALTIVDSGEARGKYLNFAAGTDSGNRSAYTMLDEAISGKFTLSLDVKLTAGVLSNRSQSAFMILSEDAKDYNVNAAATGGYILKLTNEPPADASGNKDNYTNQTKWILNDGVATVDIPAGEWITITAEVDSDANTATIFIRSYTSGAIYYEGTVQTTGAGNFAGIQMLRGRGIGTMAIDTITVK